MGPIQSTKDQWNANLYDGKHAFVSEYGNSLIELLDPQQGEKILDLGCGTGDLANKIHKLGAEIIGVDHSENMVEQAIRKYPHLPFIVKDARDLGFNNQFDGVFSNAVLHWVQPAIEVLQNVYQSLKQCGRFTAEFGGKGNVQTITNEIIEQIKEAGFEFKQEQFPWYYPSVGEYSSLMEEVGFHVSFACHFDRPTPLEGENGLRNWMDMFANQFFEGIPIHMKEEIVKNVENNLKESLYKDGKWMADYKRIRVVGVKKASTVD